MTHSPERTGPSQQSVDHAVCVACGLLCDDIGLRVEAGRIVEAERACELGRSWFLADPPPPGRPAAMIDGAEVTLDEAIGRASAILSNAKAPLVTGLSGSPIETQALAVALADRINALIESGRDEAALLRTLAIQRAGLVSTSFGEVRHRADLVLLWGEDPTVSHPRFWERVIDLPGRFIPAGRASRRVLVVDQGASGARERADASLAIPSGCHAESLRAIRAILRGIDLIPDRVERACGVPLVQLSRWAGWLRDARYAVIAFGETLAAEGCDAVEALISLVDDLNRTNRCVTLPMVGAGNPAGAEAVMTGRLGAPMAVDLSDGTPRFLPLDADSSRRLDAGEVDVVLEIGGPVGSLPFRSQAPVIRLSPGATSGGGANAVAIDCSTPGIDSGGTVVRSDEVYLSLRPALEPDRPTDREVLWAILDRLASDS